MFFKHFCIGDQDTSIFKPKIFYRALHVACTIHKMDLWSILTSRIIDHPFMILAVDSECKILIENKPNTCRLCDSSSSLTICFHGISTCQIVDLVFFPPVFGVGIFF